MKKLLSIVVVVLLAVVLAGCSEQADIPTVLEETPQLEEVAPEPTEEQVDDTTTPEETAYAVDAVQEPLEEQAAPLPINEEALGPRDNWGVTSARVRVYVYDWFDLSQIEHYHEFVYSESDIRVIFVTEATVRDFRVLSIVWNDDYFNEGAGEGERRYSVSDVLYHLDELTPGVPFVMEGGISGGGSALATDGFSFIDEDGVVRYFAFHASGYEGDTMPYSIKEF